MIVEPKGYYDFVKAINDDFPKPSPIKDEDIVSVYHVGYEMERRATNGHIPIVCVAGKDVYDQLMGTLTTLYGMPIVQDRSGKERMLEFMGTTIVPSYSLSGRFIFGSEDSFWRDQNETKDEKQQALIEGILAAHDASNNRLEFEKRLTELLEQKKSE